MHEVSIAEGILSAVESTLVNEPDAKVSSVTINIGELAGVESQALLFAWDFPGFFLAFSPPAIL